MSHTVSKESDYRGKQEEVVVLSVIIGEETEVVGVRTCLTWKPLSVLTLMGRPKQGQSALTSPSTPGLRHNRGLELSRIAKWGLEHPSTPPATPVQTPPILVQLFLIKSLPQPPLPYSTNHRRYHPHPSVPFSSNRAVWPSSPAFNLPSRSGAEANKAPR